MPKGVWWPQRLSGGGRLHIAQQAQKHLRIDVVRPVWPILFTLHSGNWTIDFQSFKRNLRAVVVVDVPDHALASVDAQLPLDRAEAFRSHALSPAITCWWACTPGPTIRGDGCARHRCLAQDDLTTEGETFETNAAESAPAHIAERHAPIDGGLLGQAEDALAQDVVLDLVGAAGDRLGRG